MLSIALTVLFRHFSHQENLHRLSAVLLKLSFVLFFHLLCVCKIHRFMLSFHRALPPPTPIFFLILILVLTLQSPAASLRD